MSHIIAGRFDTQAEADVAALALDEAGFARHEYSSFYVGPSGQHAQYPLGGDAHHDQGTEQAAGKAMAGGALGGAAGLAIGGVAAATGEPALAGAAVIAGAGVGAFAGSLQGALSGSGQGNPAQASTETPVTRQSGILLAVQTEREGSRERALEVMRRHHATDLEEAEGEWRDGRWQDFDPVRPPQRIA